MPSRFPDDGWSLSAVGATATVASVVAVSLLVAGVAGVAGVPATPATGPSLAPESAALAADSGASDDPDAILVVEDAETGRTLLGVPVENGTNVSLVYTHSVEKTRVVDGYTVRGDRLVMTRMVFSSFGAGLPSRADVHSTGNDSYAFDPPGAYEELYVAPGEIAGHRLRIGDRSYDLVGLSNSSSVRIHLAGCAASEASGGEQTTEGAA